MRPAQKAPENGIRLAVADTDMAASMRPAQKAPENQNEIVELIEAAIRFNEAGAKSAGKPGRMDAARGSQRPRFNEAGAKSAGKRS